MQVFLALHYKKMAQLDAADSMPGKLDAANLSPTPLVHH